MTGTSTVVIRVCVSSVAHVLISAAGTAATTTNGMIMGAGIPEYFKVVNPASGVKVSAIQLAAGGTLSVTEMTL